MKNYYEEDQKLFQAVAKLVAGDMDSYYVMYDLSVKYIYKIIYDITKDYHTTEDLVQETYLTIYNKINTLQEPSKFYAWAGRIATNLTFRYMKKNSKELLTLDSEEGASEFAFEVATQDKEEFIPENILMDMEKQRLITEIVDGLSVEQKVTVQYFYYEEMSVTEIAEAMECSRGTVMSRLNYARKAIKAAVVDLAENKNTRLYSLGELPLFYVIFRRAVEEFLFDGAAVAGTAMVGAATTATSEMSAEISKGTTAGNASKASSAVAGNVGKGMLAKVGTSLGIKIAAGVASVGLVVAGGFALKNALKNDKPKTVPMVINMESCLNTDTVDDAEDRFTYEYITVKQEDEEITIGYDSEIYQYGFDNYETLSPELEELHQEKGERIIQPAGEKMEEIVGDEIEFTIDGEDFAFHTEEVKVVVKEDITTIVITGECEVPDNAEDIYEKYQAKYEEKLAELVEEATTETDVSTEAEADMQPELDPRNELVREYYMGVLQNLYLYNTDPFGNSYDYHEIQGWSEIYDYAICDMDGDGVDELIVRYGAYVMVYEYDINTMQVREEFSWAAENSSVQSLKFYEYGYVLGGSGDPTYILKLDTVTGTSEMIWHCNNSMGINWYQSHANDSVSLEEYLAMYDNDGNGVIYYEEVYDGSTDTYSMVYYDDAELEARISEIMGYSKPLDIQFTDISTVVNQ